MAKSKTMYVCSNCGEESLTWQGKCPVCGQWNTFKEISVAPQSSRNSGDPVAAPKLLVTDSIPGNQQRVSTKMAEFDRVLGGGIVPGSVVLLGGEPGIGKSTLLLQAAQHISQANSVIYFSGEESEFQVGGRAKRLGITPSFLFSNETRIESIRHAITTQSPQLVIVDSIQTLYDDRFPSTPGSLVQVRECALQLQELAKRTNVSIILVGHITKEGTVAGPKTLEHMVDVVLYLEGEPRTETRILRSIKNRFGATYEIGLFALEESGLQDITNSASLFIEEHDAAIPGTALTAVLEGARPLLVEVQALVVPTVFGYPKRTSLGIDIQRLHILLAILERRLDMSLSSHDVFINVVGGYKIVDRQADAGLCMALLSAASGEPLPQKQVYYGEIGLTGEIRRSGQTQRINSEVTRLGYTPMPQTKNLRELALPFAGSTTKRKAK